MDSFEPEPLEDQPTKGPRHRLTRKMLIKIIVLAIAVIIVVALVWYFAQHRSKTQGSFHLGPVQVFNANCSYDDANLCKFLNNWPNQKNYTITSTSVNTDGQTVKTTFSLAGDSKTQLSSATNGKSTYDLITIGNTSYTKDYSDGKWLEQTSSTEAGPATEKNFQFNTNPDTNHPDVKPSYKFVSQGACDQQNCLKYQVVFANEDYQEFIWFDTSDYLLRSSTIQQGNGPTTTIKYDYGSVNISTPTPTKKLSADQIPT